MAGRPVEDLVFSLLYKTGVDWNEAYWSNARFELAPILTGHLDLTKEA